MARTHVDGDPDPKQIGKRLRRARNRAGLSQRVLAAKTPYTAAYISRVEAGERNPTFNALRWFAQPLHVTPEWLETGKDLVTITVTRAAAEKALTISDLPVELADAIMYAFGDVAVVGLA